MKRADFFNFKSNESDIKYFKSYMESVKAEQEKILQEREWLSLNRNTELEDSFNNMIQFCKSRIEYYAQCNIKILKAIEHLEEPYKSTLIKRCVFGMSMIETAKATSYCITQVKRIQKKAFDVLLADEYIEPD